MRLTWYSSYTADLPGRPDVVLTKSDPNHTIPSHKAILSVIIILVRETIYPIPAICEPNLVGHQPSTAF